MTEAEARAAILRDVGPAAFQRLETLASLVGEENERQNLVGRSTLSILWQRHMLDSLQLRGFAGQDWQSWLDIGTGGGFPGLAIACVDDRPIVLVEPRQLRANFLVRAAGSLGLSHVTVRQMRVELLKEKAAVISARAVTSPQRLLRGARNCATQKTRWLFPVGRWTGHETRVLAAMYPTMTFHVEQSRSSADAAVLIADGVPM